MLIPNTVITNASLHILENGCKWRALPECYGEWHTAYMRLRHQAEAGVLARLLAALREQELTDKNLKCLGLDSTSAEVHPDGTGAKKKRPAKHRQVPGRLEHEDPRDRGQRIDGIGFQRARRAGPRGTQRPALVEALLRADPQKFRW